MRDGGNESLAQLLTSLQNVPNYFNTVSFSYYQLTCTKKATRIRRFHLIIGYVHRFLHHWSGFHRSEIRSAAINSALIKPSSSKLPSALVAQSSSNNRKCCNTRDSPENHAPRRQGAVKVGACATPGVWRIVRSLSWKDEKTWRQCGRWETRAAPGSSGQNIFIKTKHRVWLCKQTLSSLMEKNWNQNNSWCRSR